MEVEGRQKLKDVVADCTIRWFRETIEEAESGNAEMMMLTAQMLQEGYGCEQDPHAAQAWVAKSKVQPTGKGK